MQNFDGLSDIVMGMIIDKTKTRWGKARPWLLFMGLPLICQCCQKCISMMATLVVATITPSIIGKFGGFNSQSAWTTTVLLYGIIAFVCIMITFLKYIDSLKLIPRTNKGWRMK